MTQALFAKRMRLAAAAVLLIAFAAALFAAWPSANAQNIGHCSNAQTLTLSPRQSCTIADVSQGTGHVNVPVDKVAITYFDSLSTITVTAARVGTQAFTTRTGNWVSNTFTFTVVDRTTAQAGLSISLDDSDGVVSAGGSVGVTLSLNVEALTTAATRTYTPNWIRLSGGLLGGCEGTAATACALHRIELGSGANSGTSPATASSGLAPIRITIPAGTPSGEYTISVNLQRTVSNAQSGAEFTAMKKFTVGDPGAGLASANLSLARTFDVELAKRHALPGDSNTTPETAAEAAGSYIFLSMSILNSRGNPAAAASFSSITISAPGGTIRLHSIVGTQIVNSFANGSLTLPVAYQGRTYAPRAMNYFSVTRTSPGKVTVQASASGAGGNVNTEAIELTFTGRLNKLSLSSSETTILNHYRDRDTDGAGTDTDTDPRDDLAFVLSAADSAGGAVGLGTGASATVTIRDPDGAVVQRSRIALATPSGANVVKQGARTVIPIYISSGVGSANPLKSGEYTIEAVVRQTRTPEVKTSAKFTVVGLANTIELEADETTPTEVGQVVTVTATITDADGNNVADGTQVSFDAAGGTAGVAVATRIGTTGTVPTKAGKASARYAIAASGEAVIDVAADGVLKTIVLNSTAGGPITVEPPVEIRGAAGLASIRPNSYSSWRADNNTTAAELFDSLARRGVRSIQLWNGKRWVRYAVNGGETVPGSINFTVVKGDVLYIGG